MLSKELEKWWIFLILIQKKSPDSLVTQSKNDNCEKYFQQEVSLVYSFSEINNSHKTGMGSGFSTIIFHIYGV